MSTNGKTDFALRTISDDGTFRVLVARTTETARGMLRVQRPAQDKRGLLTDLASAAILLRLTMSPDYRLQAIIQRRGAGSIIVDAQPDGITRGLVQQSTEAPLEFGPNTNFAVHRALFGGDLHQGIVETSSGQLLSDVVTGYLDRSEQIASATGLAHRFSDDALTGAGGYIIQLLPGADEATLALMTARLETMPPAEELFAQNSFEPSAIAEELYGPIGFRQIGTDDFRWGCTCSPERIIQTLSTLPEDDITELLADDDHLKVDCDYCGTTHEIAASTLGR